MAGEYGQIAIQGFQTGLNIQRNLEETRQLIRSREEKEQASQLIKDAMAEMQAQTEKQAIPAAEYAQLDRAERAGQPIDKGRKAILQQELIDLATDGVKLQAAMSNKLMASGNMTAMDKGQELLKQSVDNMAVLGGLHLKGQELQDARDAGAADRGLKRELAGQAEAGETQRVGMKLAAERSESALERALKQNLTTEELASREKIAGEQVGAQRDIADAENTTKNRQVTAGIRQDDRDFTERKREWDLMNDSPAKKIGNLLEIGSGINALKAQGMTDEQIDKLMPEGASVAQFENTFSRYSEDTGTKLKALEQRRKNLLNRQEHGENVKDMLGQVDRKMATLRRIDDEIARRQLDWENYADDHNAVEVAGARFSEFMAKKRDFIGGLVGAPVFFPAGALGGPAHRKGGPERGAAEQGKAAPPNGNPNY